MEILGKTRDWLVCTKDPGLLAVPGKGPDKADCLLSRLAAEYPSVLTVHRLDQPTSGLMVWALNKEAQRRLSRQFEERKVKKEYEALVTGAISEKQGEIRLKQRLDVENRPLQIVDPLLGKEGITRWELMGLEEVPGIDQPVSRLRLYPETGRTHQLRLHLSSIGHPIVGDNLYGGWPYERMVLHAARLEFEEPSESGLVRRFESSTPF